MATYNIATTATVQDGRTIGLGGYNGGPRINYSVDGTPTKIYSASVSAGTAQTYDVNSGLTDAYGTALVYSTVSEVVIYNTHASASLTVGGGSNPLFGASELVTIKAGKCVSFGAVPVTVSGSAKVLTVTPSASCTWQIVILGN